MFISLFDFFWIGANPFFFLLFVFFGVVSCTSRIPGILLYMTFSFGNFTPPPLFRGPRVGTFYLPHLKLMSFLLSLRFRLFLAALPNTLYSVGWAWMSRSLPPSGADFSDFGNSAYGRSRLFVPFPSWGRLPSCLVSRRPCGGFAFQPLSKPLC